MGSSAKYSSTNEAYIELETFVLNKFEFRLILIDRITYDDVILVMFDV